MFSIVVDGKTDITCSEQESIAIRFVDPQLCPDEVFLGFYNMIDTAAQSLQNMICDVLLRLNLPISMLRGQTYDGATNMSGKFNGTQALIAQKKPLALFVHCLMHCGNLAALTAIESTPIIRDATSTVNELGTFSHQSTKLSAILKSVQSEHGTSSSTLRPLCPTRVLCRGPAFNSVLQNLGRHTGPYWKHYSSMQMRALLNKQQRHGVSARLSAMAILLLQ